MSDDTYETERPREERTESTSGWHAVDVGHLVMGVAFLGLTVVWALRTADLIEVERAGWVLGLPWLIGGAVGLIAIVLTPRKGPRARNAWKQDWRQQMQDWKVEQKRVHLEWKRQLDDWKHEQKRRSHGHSGHHIAPDQPGQPDQSDQPGQPDHGARPD